MATFFQRSVICASFVLWGCGAPDSQELNSLQQAGASSKSAEQSQAKNMISPEDLALLLSPVPIGGESLPVYKLMVINVIQGGVKKQAISFVASTGTDYIETTLCSESSGNCTGIKKTIFTQEIIDVNPEGSSLTAEARGCVFGEHASDKKTTCGQWSKASYSKISSLDAGQTTLLKEKRRLESDLELLATEVQTTLQKFAADAKICEKDASQRNTIVAMRGLTTLLVSAGGQLLTESLKNKADGQSSGLVIQKPNSSFSEYLDKYTTLLSNSGDKSAIVSKLSATLTNLKNNSPINAISTLGGAIFDLFTASKQSGGQCLAIQTTNNSLDAIKTRIKEIQKQLKINEQQLKERTLP